MMITLTALRHSEGGGGRGGGGKVSLGLSPTSYPGPFASMAVRGWFESA